MAGPVRVRGETGVYYSEIDRTLHLIAVDLTDGTERWRRVAHQHGRIPGVVFTPYVDEALGAVVTTTYDGTLIQLQAVDLETGTERWQSETEWAQLSPYRCIDDEFLCLPLADGRTALHDPETGTLVDTVNGGLERTIGGSADLRLSADSGGGDVELGRFTADGYQQVWRRPLSDFVTPEQAVSYGPNGGWSAHVDADSGRSLFSLGALPIGDRDADITVEIAAEYARLGSLVAVAAPDGTPEFGGAGPALCYDLPFRFDVFWTCDETSVVEVTDFDDDGTLDPQPAVARLIRRSVDDPEDPLTVGVDPVPTFGGGFELTSDANLVVINPVEGESRLLDLERGELADVTDDDDLVVACEVPDEASARSVVLETFDGEENDYIVTNGSLGLCDLAGDSVDVLDHLGSVDAPPWFGLARSTDADAHTDVDGAGEVDGFVLWTAADRILRGSRHLSPAARARQLQLGQPDVSSSVITMSLVAESKPTAIKLRTA